MGKQARTQNGGAAMFWELFMLSASLAGAALVMRFLVNQLDPRKAQKEAAAERKRELKMQLGIDIDLAPYEEVVALDVINPRNIDVSLHDIGGLEDIVEALRNKVILPLQRPELFQTRRGRSPSLLRQVKGVLLYGPPGTGKTLLAKALAKESGARFINLKASSLLSKWFGETQKMVCAVFTLAHKMAPTIIFIDEVDALLGQRKTSENEAMTTMKTEFMQLWDGFMSDSSSAVTVLAATNRPYDLDEAVLRRFPLQFHVPLPGAADREKILRLLLGKHVSEMGPGTVDDALLENVPGPSGTRPLQEVAKMTNGCSGSDLFELCSQAAAVPIHEYAQLIMELPPAPSGAAGTSEEEGYSDCLPDAPRPLTLHDLKTVVSKHRPAHISAHQYHTSQKPGTGSSESTEAMWGTALAALLQQMAAGNHSGAMQGNGNGKHEDEQEDDDVE